MRGLPFFKPKNKPQFAGMNFSDASSGGGGGGGGDTSALVNKTDLTAIILTGTINTSGSTITSGTWFYLNGVLVKAKVDIASGATFTLNTNYEEKTIGSALSELNSNLIAELTCDGTHDIAYYTNQLYQYVNQLNTDRLLKSSIVVNFSNGQYITRSPFEIKTPNGYLYAYIDNGAIQSDNTHIYGLKVASNVTSWHYTQTTVTSKGNSITDKSSEVWTSNTKIYLYA